MNLENMEMSARLILPGIIRTYDPGFRYDAAWMTSFRLTSVANNSGTLQLMTSRATSA